MCVLCVSSEAKAAGRLQQARAGQQISRAGAGRGRGPATRGPFPAGRHVAAPPAPRLRRQVAAGGAAAAAAAAAAIRARAGVAVPPCTSPASTAREKGKQRNAGILPRMLADGAVNHPLLHRRDHIGSRDTTSGARVETSSSRRID